jgi:hypothetical protein
MACAENGNNSFTVRLPLFAVMPNPVDGFAASSWESQRRYPASL